MKVVSKTKKFEVIHEMTKTGYTVTILCDIAGVTRSGVLQMDKTAYDAFKKTIRGYRN
ncbi:hypothetical protein [Bacillus mycoides]|uniref:hypothetical protein n=1 Tax=Bacillus mycoides TaxID=1405 RepID=UPI0012FC7329|nr:hypothetical protein [Bacillus mycoides]